MTLYKRNVDGSVQQWTIEVKANSYRTISGRKDGQLVTSAWTVCKGKNQGKANGTTDDEQAVKEAAALAQKKRDKGYGDNVNDLDSHGIVKPMLAAKWSDDLRREEVLEAFKSGHRVFTQPKLDGVRCLTDAAAMMSRQWKPLVSAPHVLKNLHGFFNGTGKGVMLDGELYAHKLKADFDRIISLARRTAPTAEELEDSARELEYHVYDMVCDSMPFSERIKWITKHLSKIPSVHVVTTLEVRTLDELDEAYGRFIEEGYEGQMIRVDGPYEQNKRSKFLLKRKEFIDEEFTIVRVESGVGNREGCPILVLITEDGKEFRSALKCNVLRQREIYSNRDAIVGEQATIRYQNMTKDGVPRFPVAVAIREWL